MNRNIRKCRRCKSGPIPKEDRLCEVCKKVKICSACKKELLREEFEEGKMRCKKCTDLIKNYKRCFTCKEIVHKSNFIGNNNSCNDCKEKRIEKYERRKCKKCKKVKYFEDFNYMMSTCKECTRGEQRKIIHKKTNTTKHCKYCGVETNNKKRVCDDCNDTIKCRKCEKRLKKSKFEEGKFICKKCLQQKKIKKEKIKEKKHKVHVICNKCKKKEIVRRRYKNKPYLYICDDCDRKRYEGNDGSLVKCKICNKDFLFISAGHIKKCSNGEVTYQIYLEKYGRDVIYSEKYRNRLIQTNEEVDKAVYDKISKKSKKWWKENREKMCKKLKIAQNTPEAIKNHKKGHLNFIKNRTKEQKIKHSESARKSWQRESTRRKRIIAINKPESIEARRRGGRKAGLIATRNSPKISKPTLKLYNVLKEKRIDCELEYEFGFYHIDIGIPFYKIAIEVDGDYWHGNQKIYKILTKQQKDRQSRDKARNTYLANRGWIVLRFWTSKIDKEIEFCVNKIIETIEERKCLIKAA